MKFLVFLLIEYVVNSMELPTYQGKCAACLKANPVFRYSCNRCYDDAFVGFCGLSTKNLLECPRANPSLSYCQNALVGNSLYGTF